jgi:hypothetical protein
MYPRRIPRIVLARAAAATLGCSPRSPSSVAEPAPRLPATLIPSQVSYDKHAFSLTQYGEKILPDSAD